MCVDLPLSGKGELRLYPRKYSLGLLSFVDLPLSGKGELRLMVNGSKYRALISWPSLKWERGIETFVYLSTFSSQMWCWPSLKWERGIETVWSMHLLDDPPSVDLPLSGKGELRHFTLMAIFRSLSCWPSLKWERGIETLHSSAVTVADNPLTFP